MHAHAPMLVPAYPCWLCWPCCCVTPYLPRVPETFKGSQRDARGCRLRGQGPPAGYCVCAKTRRREPAVQGPRGGEEQQAEQAGGSSGGGAAAAAGAGVGCSCVCRVGGSYCRPWWTVVSQPLLVCAVAVGVGVSVGVVSGCHIASSLHAVHAWLLYFFDARRCHTQSACCVVVAAAVVCWV